MTTTQPPSAEEIAFLAEFCRNELADRLPDCVKEDELFGAHVEYIQPAKRALAIAERLPALLERETLKDAMPSKEAIEAAADYHSLRSGHGSFALPATFNWHECLTTAYAKDVDPIIAERDALKKERDELQSTFDHIWNADMRAIERWAAEKPQERALVMPDQVTLTCWLGERLREAEHERDRLAAEVDRLKRLCSGGDYDMLQSEQAWKRRAESAERESAAANAALQKIGMSIGSSDEWPDQATMIADVEGRVARLTRENAAMREALNNLSCGCGTMCMLLKPKEACTRYAATKALGRLAALAQLDAPPAEGEKTDA